MQVAYSKSIIAGYGLRKLEADYSGNCIRVKATDATEHDIGFSGREMDWSTAASIVSTNGGPLKVKTIYDQVGSADLAQSTDANMPELDTTNKALSFLGSEYMSGSPAGLTSEGTVVAYACYNLLNQGANTGYLYKWGGTTANEAIAVARLKTGDGLGPENSYFSWDGTAGKAGGLIKGQCWTIFCQAFSDSAPYHQLYKNTHADSVTDYTGFGPVSGTFYLGSSSASTDYLDGLVKEVLVFDKAISARQQDHIERGLERFWNAQTPGTTQLTTGDCGSTIADFEQNLHCDPVDFAQAYEFKVERSADSYEETAITDNSDPEIPLYKFPDLDYNKTYDVTVRARVLNKWGGFGSSCQITTPALGTLTRLTTNGELLSAATDIINYDAVTGATDYMLEFIGKDNPAFHYRFYRYSALTTIGYDYLYFELNDATLLVRVKAYTGSGWQKFGPSRTINIPPVPEPVIDDPNDQVVLSTHNERFDLVAVGGANNSLWEVIGTGENAGYHEYYYRANGLTNFDFTALYTERVGGKFLVRARAFIGDDMGEWGAFREVIVPDIPVTKLRDEDSGITLTALDQLIYCDAVSGANNYQYEFTCINPGFEFVEERVRGNFLTNLSLTGSVNERYGKTYDVRVKARVGDRWGEYGPVRQLTTPAFPSAEVQPAYHGVSFTNMTDQINVDTIPGVIDWEWRAEADSGEANGFIDHRYRGNNLTNLSINGFYLTPYNTTLKIQVRAFVGDEYGPFGSIATIYTPPVPATKVSSGYCGTTLTNGSITCDSVSEAYGYEFRFKIDGEFEYAAVTNTTTLDLTMIEGLQPSKTYNVHVRARVTGVWGEYGTESCTISTSSSFIAPSVGTTQIQSIYDGTVLTEMGANFYCDSVSGATNYLFEFIGTGNHSSFRCGYLTTSTLIRLTYPNWVRFGETYQIRVKAKVGGEWGNFGSTATVTVPALTTELSSSHRDTTLTDLDEYLYCYSYNGVSNYAVEVSATDGSHTETYYRRSASTSFRFSWLKNPRFSKTYNLRFKMMAGNKWTDWGPSHQVHTPSFTITKLIDGDVGTTLATMDEYFYVDNVPGVRDYELEIDAVDGSNTERYQRRSGNTTFRLSWFNAPQFNMTYNIRARSRVGPEWSSWGPVRQLSAGNPPDVKLRDADVGTTVSLDDYIYVDTIPGAKDYLMEMVEVGATYRRVYPRRSGSTSFRLGWVHGAQYGKTYKLRFKVRVGSYWTEFGTPRLIHTIPFPTTKIQDAYAGTTVASMDTYFYCDAIDAVQDFEWEAEATDGSHKETYFRRNSSTSFRMIWFKTQLFNKTYDIRIRARVGGVWGPWGPVRQITTPAS